MSSFKSNTGKVLLVSPWFTDKAKSISIAQQGLGAIERWILAWSRHFSSGTLDIHLPGWASTSSSAMWSHFLPLGPLWRFSKLWKVSSTVASSESRCPVWDDSYFKQFPILWERWPNMACESVSLFWEVLHLLLIPGQYLLNCYSVRYCQAHWHFWWGDRGKV